jgi:hypothetical protein
MTKQEFLSASLPYGLAIKNSKEYDFVKGIDECEVTSLFRGNLTNIYSVEEVVPIIRHSSDLTKPCVQVDYNNGEPFVPIIELTKITGINIFKPKVYHDNFDYGIEGRFYNFYLRIPEWDFTYTDGYEFYGISNQFRIFQQLLKWHFWIDMPESEEVVYVTEEFNPYK